MATLGDSNIGQASRADSARAARWFISLQAWLIQDGQYNDIAVHDILRFRVAFGYRRLWEATPTQKVARHIGGNAYEVLGEASMHSSGSLVLDCGLVMITHHPPAHTCHWLGAEVSLNVDENWRDCEGNGACDLPGLYEWRVVQLWRKRALLNTMAGSDPSGADSRAYTPVSNTNALQENISPAEAYLLRCLPVRRIS